METCHEYLGCNNRDCKMYGRKDNKRCWEVEGTLCNHHGIEIAMEKLTGKKKEEACALASCIYYKAAKDSIE